MQNNENPMQEAGKYFGDYSKQLGCESCAFRNPKGTATAIIIRDNKLLLLKRNEEPFKGLWDLPGGYMNEGETPDITLNREIREELGIEAIELTQMSIYPGKGYWKGRDFPVIAHFYLVEIGQREIKLNEESAEYQWLPIKDLKPKELPFFVAFDSNVEFLKELKETMTFDLERVKELIKQLDPTATLNEQSLYKAVINGKVAEVIIMDEANKGGKLVAMGWIFKRQTMLRNQAVIEDMICDEAYRGKGYGQAVLEMLLDWAKTHSVEVVELTSGWHREAAHALYKKNGFEIHDTAHMLLKL